MKSPPRRTAHAGGTGHHGLEKMPHVARAIAHEPQGLRRLWAGLSALQKTLVIAIPSCVVAAVVVALVVGSIARRASEERLRAEIRAAGAEVLKALDAKWRLEGQAFAECQSALNAISEAGAGESERDRERLLRSRMRAARSSRLQSDARELLGSTDPESRRLLEEAARQLGIGPADFLLDLLAYRGFEHHKTLELLWKNPNRYTYLSGSVVASLLEGLAAAPSADAGATPVFLTEEELKLRLFGAQLHARLDAKATETTAAGSPSSSPLDSVAIRTNYHRLHQPALEQSETARIPVVREGADYRLDYSGEIREYLASGNRASWCVEIAGGSRPERRPDGRPPARAPATEAGPRDLAKLYEELSPAVPLIEIEGGSGSGFLVEQNGHAAVVTNLHVVVRATEEILVQFFKANSNEVLCSKRILASNCRVHHRADAAVISMSGFKSADEFRELGIEPIPLAPRDHAPRVGEEVITIGHPGGMSSQLISSFSRGMVTGPIREVGEEKIRFLQTDAQINPGNSGGPLVDRDGQAVGIATMAQIWSSGGMMIPQGLNFALDIGYVHDLLEGQSLSLSDKKREMVEQAPLLARLWEGEMRLTSRGYRLQAFFEKSVAAGASAETAVPLAPGVETAIWVVAVADGTLTSREVEVELKGDPPLGALQYGKQAVGIVVEARPGQPGKYAVVVKNPGSDAVRVNVRLYRK